MYVAPRAICSCLSAHGRVADPLITLNALTILVRLILG